MTNEELLAKIKAEIERLKKPYEEAIVRFDGEDPIIEAKHYLGAYNSVLRVLDELEMKK